jgi:hypothetical protein
LPGTSSEAAAVVEAARLDDEEAGGVAAPATDSERDRAGSRTGVPANGVAVARQRWPASEKARPA